MLKKGEIRMIHKWLREGMSKSSIARRLGISRETVRKYALKPEGYVPVISGILRLFNLLIIFLHSLLMSLLKLRIVLIFRFCLCWLTIRFVTTITETKNGNLLNLGLVT